MQVEVAIDFHVVSIPPNVYRAPRPDPPTDADFPPLGRAEGSAGGRGHGGGSDGQWDRKRRFDSTSSYEGDGGRGHGDRGGERDRRRDDRWVRDERR